MRFSPVIVGKAHIWSTPPHPVTDDAAEAGAARSAAQVTNRSPVGDVSAHYARASLTAGRKMWREQASGGTHLVAGRLRRPEMWDKSQRRWRSGTVRAMNTAPTSLTIAAADLQRELTGRFGIRPGFVAEFASLCAIDAAITFAEAGLALAAGVITDEGEVEDAVAIARTLGLARIRVRQPTMQVETTIPACGLLEHPLFARWVAPHFGMAVADIMRFGAIWTHLAADSPQYRNIELAHHGAGRVSAVVKLDWSNTSIGAIEVFAEYGVAADADDTATERLALPPEAIIQLACGCPVIQAAPSDIAAAVMVAPGLGGETAQPPAAGTIH